MRMMFSMITHQIVLYVSLHISNGMKRQMERLHYNLLLTSCVRKRME